MCMAVYLGSNSKLNTISWDEKNPSFFVNLLEKRRKEDELIYQNLKKENLYYLGSHEGCSCGFQLGEYDFEDEEKIEKMDSISKLKNYLFNVISVDPDILIYSCWEGDQIKPIKTTKSLNIHKINVEKFWFEELQLLSIVS